jgi:hypothetical protein
MTTVDGRYRLGLCALHDLAKRCRYVDVDLDVLDLRCRAVRGPSAGCCDNWRQPAGCGGPSWCRGRLVEVDPGHDRDGLTMMNAVTAFLAFVSVWRIGA